VCVEKVKPVKDEPNFTPLAKRRWAEPGGDFRVRVLNRVWCVRCRDSTVIVDYSGKIKQGDLILQGRCIACRGPLARLIEKE